MKIAIVTAGGADASGTERVIPCFLWLIERLVRGGDEVHVFCLHHNEQVGSWMLLGATVHNAGGAQHVLRLFRQIVTEHRRSPFDVIHTLWSTRANVVAVAAAKWLSVPVLVYYGAGELAALPDTARFGRQLSARGRFWLRVVTAAADRVGAQSQFVVDLAIARGIDAQRMPLGVALDRWPCLAPRRRMPGAPARLLYVAYLTQVKDPDMLLRAAQRLRDLKVEFEIDCIGADVAGDGAFARLAADLGLQQRIRFHGFMQHHKMRPYFEAADVLVLTSRYEAGPLVVLEAAIAGVPTVGTNVGHLSEWAPTAARVVEPRDAAALADSLAEVLTDEDMRLQLAMQAQARALSENADVTTRRFQDVYMELQRNVGLQHPT
jgi:glycosyltransferase involved in cell wall biosynthesis